MFDFEEVSRRIFPLEADDADSIGTQILNAIMSVDKYGHSRPEFVQDGGGAGLTFKIKPEYWTTRERFNYPPAGKRDQWTQQGSKLFIWRSRDEKRKLLKPRLEIMIESGRKDSIGRPLPIWKPEDLQQVETAVQFFLNAFQK